MTNEAHGSPRGPRDGDVPELHIGFIMSTEVGLRTQLLNWTGGLTPDLRVTPEWIVVDWWKHGGTIERTPFLPDTIKARMRAEVQIRAGLKHGPYDALFVAQERMLHAMNAALFRQPYFITADVTAIQLAGFGPLYNKEQWGPAFYEGYKHRERCDRLRRAAALFPWSRWAAESMVSDYGVDPSRVHIVPPGIDLTEWSFPRDEERYSESRVVNILFVGGDFYRKGGDLLMHWAAATQAKNWRLHVVTRDLIVPSHPNVRVYRRMQPNGPELMRLYADADVFALPTRGDCYSLAAIEAMAAGLPVILSETGGTPDIIEEGRTGFLVKPGDAEAFCDRLSLLLEQPDLRCRMGAAGRTAAERKYDARTNIRTTVQLMRQYMSH